MTGAGLGRGRVGAGGAVTARTTTDEVGRSEALTVGDGAGSGVLFAAVGKLVTTAPNVAELAVGFGAWDCALTRGRARPAQALRGPQA